MSTPTDRHDKEGDEDNEACGFRTIHKSIGPTLVLVAPTFAFADSDTAHAHSIQLVARPRKPLHRSSRSKCCQCRCEDLKPYQNATCCLLTAHTASAGKFA